MRRTILQNKKASSLREDFFVFRINFQLSEYERSELCRRARTHLLRRASHHLLRRLPLHPILQFHLLRPSRHLS